MAQVHFKSISSILQNLFLTESMKNLFAPITEFICKCKSHFTAILHSQVVADAGDCAILVQVLGGAARRRSGPSLTSSYLFELQQVLGRQQV